MSIWCADNDYVNPDVVMRSVGGFFGDWQGGILQPIDLASVDTAVNAFSVFVRPEFHRDIFS